MGGDEQRAAATPERLLQPLDGAQVQVVGGLVEHEEVRVRDQEPGQRRAGLLAARELLRRSPALGLAEAQPREGLVHALVQRPAVERGELRRELLVAGAGRTVRLLERPHLRLDRLHPGRPAADRGAEVRRGRERLVEMGLLGQQPHAEVPAPLDLAHVGLVDAGDDPEQGGLARAVRADHADALADGDRRVDPVEDHEGPDLAHDPGEPDERHRQAPPAAARAPARRVAAARRVRSARACASARALSAGVRPSTPSPGSSTQRRPLPRGGRPVARMAAAPARSAAGSRWHHEQKCVARCPTTIRRIGRPQRRHGAPARW